ncbi:hypothetical protein GOV07_01405 [Candidatus Woesearchaeota archaeon]|nr:hypothetical protein [Candidatus Woesearchaeota archaeon]
MELLFLTTFGKAFVPKSLRPHLHEFFEKTGREKVPYESFGILFWIGAVLTYFVYMSQVFPYLQGKAPFVSFAVSFVVFAALMLCFIFTFGAMWYFYLTMQIYNRTKEMEAKLPDYLTLVSTSLKGGYSFEKALWGAIKPEFGILAKEIGLVSKRVMTGNDVTEALGAFAMKYDSPLLRRSVSLIIGELESGGKIVDVIDRIIENLKKARILKEEMAASTLTYMIFIGALVMFVMPALFALSFTLFNVISGFLGNITSSMASSPVSAIKMGKPSINPRDYMIFTFLAIGIISSSSALIISIIEKGNIKSGMKYIPMFLLTSIGLYMILLKVIGTIFGSILNFG